MEPEEKTTIKKNYSKGKEIKEACANCGIETNHTIIFSALAIESVERSVVSLNDFQVIQCRGCDNLSLRVASIDINDWFDDKNTEYRSKVYPSRTAGRRLLRYNLFLPENIKNIYLETYTALGNDQPILAGIGLRALIEAVCNEKKAKGNKLIKRIDDLASKGVITRNHAEFLHGIRILGNESAHEVKANNIVEILTAMEVVEHMLNEVYLLRIKARNLTKSKRKGKRN